MTKENISGKQDLSNYRSYTSYTDDQCEEFTGQIGKEIAAINWELYVHRSI